MVDKTFDDQQTRKLFERGVLQPQFGLDVQWEATRGEDNIRWDMVITGGKYKGLTLEVKTRAEEYDDFAIEFTQFGSGPGGRKALKYNPSAHKDEGREYRRLLDDYYEGDLTKEEMIDRLSRNSAWLWRSEAAFILYINPKKAYLINKKKLKEYVILNFLSLEDRFSNKTSGAYNKIVKKSDFKYFKDITDIVDIEDYMKSWKE